MWREIQTSQADLIETPHPIKIDLKKKLDPKQKNIQAFNIDALKGLRKTRNENPHT